jgi:hypothetical protein
MFEATQSGGRGSIAVVAAGILVLGAVGAWFAWPSPPEPAPAPRPPREAPTPADPTSKLLFGSDAVKACFADRVRPADEDPAQEVFVQFGVAVDGEFDPRATIVDAGPDEKSLTACLNRVLPGLRVLTGREQKPVGWKTTLGGWDRTVGRLEPSP